MSKLLFSFRGVPEDEAFEVRELLTVNNIDFYETTAGNWGVSMPALWLKHNEDIDKANQLLHEYQTLRAKTQREIYIQLKKEGKNEQWFDILKQKPIRFFIYVGAIAFIIYLYFRMLSEFGL